MTEYFLCFHDFGCCKLKSHFIKQFNVVNNHIFPADDTISKIHEIPPAILGTPAMPTGRLVSAV